MNRNRSYAISILHDSPSEVRIRQRWGRGEATQQWKDSVFSDETISLKYVRELLLRRKRNGYKLSFISKSFPIDEVVQSFTVSPAYGEQLPLFDC